MRSMIFTAALAAILAITIVACGGDDGKGKEERLHPVLNDATYIQIQEGREYVTFMSHQYRGNLSGRINALHQEGYELQHVSSDEDGYALFVFRKTTDPEEPESPTGTPGAN